ncbi:MAG TPA: efflux RND transporter permease subunit, partial [bacterium]|nr:efflux RND transporter permease subunit [bacterium]
VGLGIRKQRGTNAVEVARAVKKRIKEVERYLPEGLQLKIRFDTTEYVEESIREIEFVMLLSVALTAFVCWIFLGSFSSAFNIFLAIPISICGTFFVLYLFGFTLNTFTLLGLSLVIGIIVDDAIMMLENITRHNEEGESRVKAALQGSREITFAAIVATISILAIFIPVIFMKGVIGKYFLQFGVTISVAVMVSLLGALTITPMYCSQYLKTGHTSRIEKFIEAIISRLRMAYAFLLERSLNHRWKIVFLSALLFAASLFLFKKLKKEFVPPQDLSRLSVRIETKTGSSIEFTDEVFRQVEEAVTQYPEVESYFSNIGGDLANSGSIMLTLKHPEDRPRDEKTKKPLTQQELMPVLRLGLKRIPGIEKVVVQDLSLMGFTARRGFPVEFTLNGSDWDKLVLLSDQIMTEMEKTGLMVDIDIDYKVGAPEVRVVPDRRKAAERGVSISTIGNTINALIGGVRVGKYTRGGRRYDIRVQLVSADRKNVQNIKKIWVRNNRGEVTP